MNQSTERILETMAKMAALHRRPWDVAGLPKGGFMVLCMLDEIQSVQKVPVTVSMLSKKMEVSPAAISQTIKGLERDSLVERISSSKDRRMVFVQPTEAGTRLLEDARKRFEKNVSKIFLKLGEEDAIRLAEILEKLYIIVKEFDEQVLSPTEMHADPAGASAAPSWVLHKPKSESAG